MHIDLEQAEAGKEFRARFCVVGGGIAGLLLATRLAERGADVLLLEAGGLEFEERSQRLYAAEMADARHAGTTEGRFRSFGGSSTRWGGQLLPYTADVFDPPDAGPAACWPIAESEIAGYYAELERLLGVDRLPFEADLLESLQQTRVDVSSDFRLRFSKWIPFAKRNLGRTLGKEALEHSRITVVSHANVAELIGNGAGAMASARVVDYGGREFRCTADHFIVAAGTVESSRLLLSSGAVANVHDQIGRYFHDHLSWRLAEFQSPAREQVLERLGPFVVDGTLHTFKLEASAALRSREDLLAVMAHVTIEEPADSGTAAVRNLLTSLQQRGLGKAVRENLLPVMAGLGDVARIGFQARFKGRRAVSKRARMYLNIDLEQPADEHRRIRLSEERDALGLPKAIVEWRIGDSECDTAARFAVLVRGELQRLGFAPEDWSEVPVLTDTYHPMGGLRMGADAASSVVDRTLRVHGVENLYVASCAVYPSGGSSNPTFTLMALALRLADELTARK